jgi:hypothetical protein
LAHPREPFYAGSDAFLLKWILEHARALSQQKIGRVGTITAPHQLPPIRAGD